MVIECCRCDGIMYFLYLSRANMASIGEGWCKMDRTQEHKEESQNGHTMKSDERQDMLEQMTQDSKGEPQPAGRTQDEASARTCVDTK